MLTLSGKAGLALICCVSLLQPLFASNCNSWSYGTPSLGTAHAVDTTSNPGTFFYYYENTGGEYTTGSGTYLPYVYYSLDVNGSGGYYSGKGSFSSPATFPAGNGSSVPYVINPSASVGAYPNIQSINTSCEPGVSCSTCEAAPPGSHGYYDCTARAIAKAPAIGLQSPSYNSVKGFNVTGYLLGAASTGTGSGGSIVASAFFGESKVYVGGREFGFYSSYGTCGSPGSISGPCDVIFYETSNANCTDGISGSLRCATQEGGTGTYNGMFVGGTGSSTYQPAYTTCDLTAASGTNPQTTHTYGAWLVQESGAWVFYITVDGHAYEWPASSYISGLMNGVVTVGMTRVDPNDSQHYQSSGNNYPWFDVSSVNIYN